MHLVGREATEYLLHPRHDRMRPMHELRHSAADNLWRRTGNLTMAQQLLRHESPATTAGYLHPTRDDLEAGLLSRSDD